MTKIITRRKTMYTEMFRLDGKVAVVIAASRGMGKAIAEGFAEMGARVAIAARKQEALDAAANDIKEAGGDCLAIACHAGKPDQIRNLFQKVKEEYGGVDILVNNSGTNPYFGPFQDAPELAIDKTIEVNLKAHIFSMQEAAKIMKGRGGGSIINISSTAGLSPGPLQGIYSVTKAGVVSLSKSFAIELGPDNIRVNAICPGLVETTFSKVLIETKEIYDAAVEGTPMKRIAKAEEVVGAAIYLASDASSFVTGTAIPIDGGRTA